MTSSVSLWLDCDTGHDDAFALLLACFHDKANLLGVSTTYGNAPVHRTTNNTKAMLQAIGCSHVRLFQGASRPLRREPIFATRFHGESGLDGVTVLPTVTADEPKESSLDTAAVAEILLSQPAGSVWLIPTGPLTNTAQLVQDYPQLVDHIGGLSIMGGAVGGGFTNAPLSRVQGETERFGNWSPYAEFNIMCDPEAAQLLFSNEKLAAKTTLITLDLSHLCRATSEVQDHLFERHRSIHSSLSHTRTLMREVLMFFAEAYHQQFSISDGPPLHDPLAVYAALCPELFNDNGGERWHIEMVTSGDRDGQTVLREKTHRGGIRVPRKVNLPEFWASIDAAMSKAETRVQQTV